MSTSYLKKERGLANYCQVFFYCYFFLKEGRFPLTQIILNFIVLLLLHNIFSKNLFNPAILANVLFLPSDSFLNINRYTTLSVFGLQDLILLVISYPTFLKYLFPRLLICLLVELKFLD